jgi:hypothetical protein
LVCFPSWEEEEEEEEEESSEKKPPCQVALAAKISTCAFSCRLCGEYGDGCCHLGALSPQHVGGRI